MLISKQHHEAVSSILEQASSIYQSVPDEEREKLQWHRPDNWRLGNPEHGIDPGFNADPSKGCWDANRGKSILWSRVINVLVREKYRSVLDIGTGSGVFPALASCTNIVPYAIEPFGDCVHTNDHWIEHFGFKGNEHYFQADLNSFLVALTRNLESHHEGKKAPPFYVDCITWFGTLHGPENAADWGKIKSELIIFLKCVPWMCKSLIISGDLEMGMMVESVMREIGVEYALTYKFSNSYHVRPDVQTTHYMFTFGKGVSKRKTIFVKDEKLIQDSEGRYMVVPPNEYGFLSAVLTGKRIHPFPSTREAIDALHKELMKNEKETMGK